MTVSHREKTTNEYNIAPAIREWRKTGGVMTIVVKKGRGGGPPGREKGTIIKKLAFFIPSHS